MHQFCVHAKRMSATVATSSRGPSPCNRLSCLTIETLNLNASQSTAVVNVTDTLDAVNITITTQEEVDDINVTDTPLCLSDRSG